MIKRLALDIAGTYIGFTIAGVLVANGIDPKGQRHLGMASAGLHVAALIFSERSAHLAACAEMVSGPTQLQGSLV